MTTKEQDVLIDLFKHDLAANEAYDDVIPHLEDADIIDKVKSFKRDHEKHIENLSNLIHKLTGEKPKEEKNLKGTLLTSYAAIRSVTGQDGALKALQTAEHVVLKRYKEAVDSKVLSSEAITLIKQNLSDEERHNSYVDSKVK